ncbi:BnaA09g13520D [Brassica napus]|uniref:BnaA09g13520D protein n=1 Tax=Brassica napus TaxID=3708 RepID=A0A078FIX6_BRANA|nr:BnaA09g13520D [Brassica napus]
MSSSLILHGRRRFFDLQKWHHLRSAVQNASAFSSAAAIVSRKGHNFTVSTYLVKSLGFTTKLAESISRKVSFNEKVNPDSVLNLFRTHGFTDSQISTIITGYPHVLIADSETCLAPKLQFLKSRGASTSELTEVLSKVPKVLVSKKDKALSVYYDFVKDIIEADKSSKFKKLSPSSSLLSQGRKQENKIRNITVLRELGMRVPQRSLFHLLVSRYQPVCGKERFQESLKKVVEKGFDPTTSKFVQALHVVYQLSDRTVEEKVDVYTRLGFSVEDVWDMFKKWPNSLKFSGKKNIASSIETFLGLGFSKGEFAMMIKRYPVCIGFSAETVKKKTEFLVEEMDWSLEAVVSHPQVFSYSMEKRMVPRCNVIRALMSKGLLGSELPSVCSVLACTDKVFLGRYVRKHDDMGLVAELMAIFTRVHKVGLVQ